MHYGQGNVPPPLLDKRVTPNNTTHVKRREKKEKPHPLAPIPLPTHIQSRQIDIYLHIYPPPCLHNSDSLLCPVLDPSIYLPLAELHKGDLSEENGDSVRVWEWVSVGKGKGGEGGGAGEKGEDGMDEWEDNR